MDKQWVQKWDNRYSEEAYAFGLNPSEYFKEKTENLKTGNIFSLPKVKGEMQSMLLNWFVTYLLLI